MLLIITLALLSGASIVLGLQLPPTTWTALLHLNDCALPCWIGIQPGQATLADGERQIQATYGDPARYQVEEHEGFQFEVTDKRSGYELVIVMSAADGAIRSISLTPAAQVDGGEPKLGDLWNNLDAPQAIYRMTGSYESLLIAAYSRQQILLYMNNPNTCNRVAVDQEVGSIVLGRDADQATYVGLLSAPLTWNGFFRCYRFTS